MTIDASIREQNRRRAAWRSALVMTAAALAVTALAGYGLARRGDNLWLNAPSAALALTSLVSAGWARRGWARAATWLLLSGFWLSLLAINIIFTQGGLVMGASAILISAMIAGQTLSAAPARRALLLSSLAGMLILAADWFGPAGRAPLAPEVQISLPWLALAVCLIFAVFMARRFAEYSLRTKLMLSFLGVNLLVVAALGALANQMAREQALASTSQTLSSTARLQALAVADFLGREVDLLHGLALDNEIELAVEAASAAFSDPTQRLLLDREWRAAAATGDTSLPLIATILADPASLELAAFNDAFPENVELIVTDQYGALVGVNRLSSDYDQTDHDWWQAARRGETYIGRPGYDAGTGLYALVLAAPLRMDENGQIIGVIRATVDAAVLKQLVSLAPLGLTGGTDLLFPDGYLNLELGGAILAPNLADQLRAANGRTLAIPYDGQPGLASAAPVSAVSGDRYLGDLNWWVVSHQTQAEALAPAAMQLRLVTLATLGVAGILALLAGWVSQRLAQPLASLQAAVEQVTAGDLEARAPTENADEIGALGRAFNTMTRRLHDLIGDLERRIREQQLAERQLRRSEDRLRRITDHMLDLIAESDADGNFRYVSPSYLRVLGYAPNSLLGQPLTALAHPEDGPALRQAIQAVFATRESRTLEFRVRHAAGHELWLEATGTAVLDEAGQPVGVVLGQRDVTERRRAEAEIRTLNAELEQRVLDRTAQLQAALKELEAFSYSVSHDLRAPLRAVDGFSRILLDDYSARLDDDGQRYLRRVRDGAQRMGQLIDDLLAFSRLGRQTLRRQAVEPAEIARAALEDLAGEREGRAVELTIAELPPAQADPALLRQVYANLLGNALKYSRGRSPARIEVGWSKLENEGVYFVRDNGVGFDMRYADKLFGVFQRLHRAEDFEGTGVGLATVQRIVNRHGGRIWAEAAVDEGATFYFTLGE